MKAVVHDRYGPPRVLRVAEVERPLPADDEVLVKVRATTVTRTDCHVRRASPFPWGLFTGLLRPRRKILGIEYAGVIEAVGVDVDRLAVGDEVFGGGASASQRQSTETTSIGCSTPFSSSVRVSERRKPKPESPSVSALTRISPPRAAAPMRAATCTPWPP